MEISVENFAHSGANYNWRILADSPPPMLLHPQFDPVAFSLGPLSVRWYGLMYLVAFVQFILLGRYRIRTRPGLLTVEQLDDLLFYGMLGVILGGRLGQVLFYEPGYYLAHPLEILAVWKGGMAFHGGFLGVLVAMGLWSRKHRIAWFDITDFIAPLVPLGLAAGRIGNFINGELWGRVADPSLPWAMIFPAGRRHAAAPSVAALSGRTRRPGAVRNSVGFQQLTATARRGIRRFPDRLRRLPLHHRILPRAGSRHLRAVVRDQHGPVAVVADGAGGTATGRTGLSEAALSGCLVRVRRSRS